MATPAQVQTRTQTHTFAALHHPNFRIYFAGQFISISGLWAQRVAQGWLVYNLTNSATWLGVVAFLAGAPFLFAPYAGVYADRFSRRQILRVTYIVDMVLALLLAGLVYIDRVEVWHIALASLLGGISAAISNPARLAFLHDLVGNQDLNSGIAINAMLMNTASIVGPSLGGLMLSAFGAEWCFFINGITFLAVLASLSVIQTHSQNAPRKGVSSFAQLKEGFVYVYRHPVLGPLYVVAIVTTLLALTTIQTLLPAFAKESLHSPIVGYTALTVGLAAGALCSASLNVWLTARLPRGKIITTLAMLLPVGAIAFALFPYLIFAVILIVVMGFGLSLVFLTTNVLMQTSVPDAMRGRVTGLWILGRFGLSSMSALGFGLIADGIGVTTTIWAGGVLMWVLCGYILAKSPALRQLV